MIAIITLCAGMQGKGRMQRSDVLSTQQKANTNN